MSSFDSLPHSLHAEPAAWFNRVNFVLLHPSHPGNVGSAARAMRVMGFKNLRVVAPRFKNVALHPDAVAFASGATDVLNDLKEFDSLDDALSDMQWKIAVSATSREFSVAAQPPEIIAVEVRELATSDPNATFAIIFGTERTGMSISQVQRCQRVCSIPGALDYQSLNLAQAVQILSYCLAQQSLVAAKSLLAAPILKDPGEQFAQDADIAAMLSHLERMLVSIEFLDPKKPKKLMPRMQRLVNRADMKRSEVDILRGIFSAIEKKAGRVD
jgi:tRNA/rRNA methyltransferase